MLADVLHRIDINWSQSSVFYLKSSLAGMWRVFASWLPEVDRQKSVFHIGNYGISKMSARAVRGRFWLLLACTFITFTFIRGENNVATLYS